MRIRSLFYRQQWLNHTYVLQVMRTKFTALLSIIVMIYCGLLLFNKTKIKVYGKVTYTTYMENLNLFEPIFAKLDLIRHACSAICTYVLYI